MRITHYVRKIKYYATVYNSPIKPGFREVIYIYHADIRMKIKILVWCGRVTHFVRTPLLKELVPNSGTNTVNT
jgi:hypothetical protein